MPAISVIVPLYKAEKYIPSLVEDIKNQTFTDWELILVNDGSPDKTFEICRKFAEEDERIKVINQKNQGPSAARNSGLAEAKGEWISFVDADDALLDNFLMSMINGGGNDEVIDIVYCGYIIVENSSNSIYSYKTRKYIGQREMHEALVSTEILSRCCPWGKLFRRKIIADNNLKFDEDLRHSEDRLFVYNYLLRSRGIAAISTIGYVYDSTNAASLKNRRLEIEMLYYRQQKLQEAAHALMLHYSINGEESYVFAKHLFGLFSSSIQNLYNTKENSKNIIRSQQDFYNIFFDHELYDEVKTTSRWKQFSAGNKMLELSIHREFKKINTILRKTNRNILIYNLISKLINRVPIKKDFRKAIHIMNL